MNDEDSTLRLTVGVASKKRCWKHDGGQRRRDELWLMTAEAVVRRLGGSRRLVRKASGARAVGRQPVRT